MRNVPVIFDRLTNKRLCFLENAFGIGYTQNLNGLDTAEFTLPASDGKNEYCQPLNYVELWDGDAYAGLYRILPSVLEKTADSRTITYRCEHVLATLMDDVLFGFHSVGNLGTYTAQSIRYVLDRQSAKRWNLLACGFSNQFLYNWENENLLSALYSIADPLDGCVWRTDTTGNPWQLSLERADTRQKGEIRYKKNMLGVRKTADPSRLCTRLYLLGYGEGDNQLTISGVNGGIPYLDSPNIARYGIVAKIAADRRFQDADSLLAYGKKLLSQLDTPYLTYEAEAAFIDGDVKPGDTVRVIDDEEGISELMPVVSIQYTDITGERTAQYQIANAAEDVAAQIASLESRQRVADCYGQGSTNIDSVSFADNADTEHPAKLRFYLSGNVVRLNAVNFIYSLEPFRAYSKGASAGGGSSTTSGGGGGTSKSTESGGGSSQTSEVSGAAAVTSGASSADTTQSGGVKPGSTSEYAFGSGPPYLYSGNVGYMYTDEGGKETDRHRHRIQGHYHYYYLPPHSHRMPHTHSVTTPAHSHKVAIPAHSHSFTVGSHTHRVEIPAHEHGIAYGIYEGGSAGSAAVYVDGRPIGSIEPNQNVDIAGYLAVDGEGKIQRDTWHEVEIRPDKLTRISASLQTIVFINPRGGQDL